MKMWESEKHHSWCMQVEGFMGHVATDGSLLGKAGKWRACGWAVDCLCCMVQGGRTWDSAHQKEGGSDGICMPSQESDWTHQATCGQQRNN